MTDYETNKTGASSVTLLKRGRLLIPDVYINKTLDNLIRDQTE
uniref:Uncharacterized protein n=1 Tax=Panagrolaimus sp. JU765 TaxID=591449 RepID=A0AC34R482_9BILA